MRVVTPQITWHNRDPVLCADFDPTIVAQVVEEEHSSSSSAKTDDVIEIDVDEIQGPEKSSSNPNSFYRVVTGGADSHLVVWHLSDFNTVKPVLLCVADLTRHTKAVNAVRFSPDGSYIASADDDAYIYIWKNDPTKNTPESECWNVEKGLRRHLEDVADLSWSGDGNYLVSASVDNSAVVWDVKKGAPIHIWSDHIGFVQGASFDPLGEFVATMATDRILRVFNPKSGKVITKALKYPKSWIPASAFQELPQPATPKQSPVKINTDSEKSENIEAEENGTASSAKQTGTEASKRLPPGYCNRLFQDDMMQTFCRRLNFSPKGEFLIVPGGLLPPNPLKDKNQSESGDPTTPGPSKKKKSGFMEKDEGKGNEISNNAIVVFCRNSFTFPTGLISTGTSYSIGARFSPIYYQRDRVPIEYDPTFMNPAKKSERQISCTARIKKPKVGKRQLLNMPHRLIFAVITNKEVLICDTESLEPIAVVRNIHCTRMSDLTWSPDGRVLLVTSTDGYCTIISFSENELGIPLPTQEELNVLDPNTAFLVPPEPKKEPKKKEPKIKKTKDKEKDAGSFDAAHTPGTSSQAKTPKRAKKKSKAKEDNGGKDNTKSINTLFDLATASPKLSKNSKPKNGPNTPVVSPTTSSEPSVFSKISTSTPASPAIHTAKTPVTTPSTSKTNTPEKAAAPPVPLATIEIIDDPIPPITSPPAKQNQKQPETPKTQKRSTFMDNWLKKTPKTGEATAPKSSKSIEKEPEMPVLKKADSDIEIVYEEIRALPPSLKPEIPAPAPPPADKGKTKKEKEHTQVKEPTTFVDSDFDFPQPSSQGSIGSLSQEQIDRLQTAPIMVDIEAEEAASQSSVIMTSDTYEVKSNGHGIGIPISPTKPEEETVEESMELELSQNQKKVEEPEAPKVGEKRPATSPLAAVPKPKQPRRVQFITLSSKASTSTNDNEGGGGGGSSSSKSNTL